jgi:ankyrin repeat protein
MWECFEAIKQGDEEQVTTLLNAEPRLLEVFDYAWEHRPLTLAAECGHLGLVKLFIQRGAKVRKIGPLNETALHWAAYGGHEGTVAFLISKGASTEWRDDEGRMPILWACEKGHVGAVRVLLEHMGEEGLEETDYDGYTGLHWAALEGHEELVTFLIGEGAQPDVADKTGLLPIMSASERGHLGVVQLLVQHMGDEVLQARDADARTVLHFAAYWGREKVVAFLLGKGAQANSRDRLGKIPLMWACERGQMGVVRMLLQHMGAQGLREAAKTGWMALHWAVHGGQEEVVAFLIGEGAGVNSRDLHGFVPLMVAAVHGHLGVVKMLLRHVEAEALQERGWDGMTALHLAAYKDHPEVVRLLLLAGADPTVVDDGGMTPRALAEDWGHVQCMAVFQVRTPHTLGPRIAALLYTIAQAAHTRQQT